MRPRPVPGGCGDRESLVPSRNSRRPVFPGMLGRSVSRRLGPARAPGLSRGSRASPGSSPREPRGGAFRPHRRIPRLPAHPAPSRSIPVLRLLPDVPVLLEHPCTLGDPDASRAPDHPICSQDSRRSWSIPVLRRDPVPEHPSVPSASQCFFCSQNSQCTWSIPLMDPHTPSASQCSQ